MPGDPTIRASVGADLAAIASLYAAAFPDEDLLPLVRELLQDAGDAMSLVATVGSAIAGHVLLTKCGIDGSRIVAALLGPLAVAPARQREGIGTALVRDGLQRLKKTDAGLVCVLGDPAYYGRLGFRRETGVEPPYRLPIEWSEAWQSQYLLDGIEPVTGLLVVPRPWREAALWGP